MIFAFNNYSSPRDYRRESECSICCVFSEALHIRINPYICVEVLDILNKDYQTQFVHEESRKRYMLKHRSRGNRRILEKHLILCFYVEIHYDFGQL